MNANQKKIVVITGASTGIGYALAKQYAKKRYHLVLVSKTKQRLTKAITSLKTKYNASVEGYIVDLAQPHATFNLAKKISKKYQGIDILINNAGFGLWGPFSQQPTQEIEAMIQLNCSSITLLTHGLLPLLKQRKGKVLLVSSVLGFFPAPFFSVYAATKSYVLSFGLALHEELKKEGIQVSILCPGATKTRFQERAHAPHHAFVHAISPDVVARAAEKGLQKNKTIIFPNTKVMLLPSIFRMLPQTLVAKVIAWFMNKR